MTEPIGDRSTWTLEQQTAHERELQQKREAWEQQRQFAKEEAARAAARQAMEEDLASKARLYLDMTGSSPPLSVVETWKVQYINEQAHLQEAEKEARRAEAEESYDF